MKLVFLIAIILFFAAEFIYENNFLLCVLYLSYKKKKNVKIVIIKHKFWCIFRCQHIYEISFPYRYYIIFRCWIHIWKQFSFMCIIFSVVLHKILNLYSIKIVMKKNFTIIIPTVINCGIMKCGLRRIRISNQTNQI